MSNKAVVISKKVQPPAEAGTYFRLMCMTGAEKGICYYLHGNRVVLGRSENAEITVLDQKSSREHCELVKHGGTYVLTDLDSQNGVMINDLKVTQHTLADGDKIIIGKTVYKFSKIVVSEPDSEEDEVDEEGEEEKESPKKGGKKQDPAQKKKRLMIAALLVVLVILFIPGGEDDGGKNNKNQKNKSQDRSRIAEATAKSQKHEDPEIQKRIETLIHRGLREYRERNYFRAINEFNLALILSPNHASASYYLSKTKQTLNEDIERLFLKARQDFDALKYEEAISSYCTVIRTLQNKPEDPRYKDAEKNIKLVENEMGVEPGETSCLAAKPNN